MREISTKVAQTEIHLRKLVPILSAVGRLETTSLPKRRLLSGTTRGSSRYVPFESVASNHDAYRWARLRDMDVSRTHPACLFRTQDIRQNQPAQWSGCLDSVRRCGLSDHMAQPANSTCWRV